MDFENINRQLDAFIGEKKFRQLADVCRSVLSMGRENLAAEEYYRLSLLAGYALFELRQFRESHELVAAVLESGHYAVDAMYLLTADLLLMEEYPGAFAMGDRFFDALNTGKAGGAVLLSDARAKAHEIANNLGTAAVKLHKYDKATEYFKRGITYNAGFALLHENLAAACGLGNRWADAESAAEEGLKHCPASLELKRMLGIALRRLHRYGEAERVLTGVRDSGSAAAHAELGILYQSMSRFREAGEAFGRFLELEPANAEVARVRKNLLDSGLPARPEPRLSAALIVRDEEEMLAQCLDSIRDAVDEIIVVDTGSKDRTIEIARRYTGAVYEHPWQDSFSEARNYSISKATGDWVLVIDADEVLSKEHILKVREYKWSDDYDCFCFAVYSQLPGHLGGVNRGKHYSPRMFRNREDIRYEGIVHNILRMPEKTVMTDIGIFHFGYDLRKDKMDRKFRRSLNLLLRQIESNPSDPFVRYNTAQMYLSRGYSVEAKEHAEKIIEVLTPEDAEQLHIYLMGLYQLVLIHLRTDNLDEAEKYGKQALGIKPNYIDPMLALGWVYYISGRFEEAEDMLNAFIDNCNKLREFNDFSMIILNKLGSEFEAYYVLGEIYLQRNRAEDAELLLGKSVELNPYFWKSYKCLGEIAGMRGDFESAGALFEEAIKLGYMNAEKYGTTGAPRQEFESLLGQYKAVQFKRIDASGADRPVDDALSRIDEFLAGGQGAR